ncbi:MAG TPA: ECF transporter S component [Brevefilum sp.]|nr:ECF transporter S component [Brevefilum sp.]HOR18811.1 ECF transporter S component [Brevefilum sp.]HPL68711.1 ECF transporter S component [Brevefilum sp.]
MERLVLALGTIFFVFDLVMLVVGFLNVHKLSKQSDFDSIAPIPIGWTNWNSKRIATLAIVIALSVVMSLIPIPSPSGTIALDLAPGYFMALFGGPINGAIAIFIGHMAVAIRAGFPLTVPVHIGIGIACAGVGSMLWFFYRKFGHSTLGLIAAVVIAILGNTFGSNILGSYIFMGLAMAIGTIPPIFVGSSANVIIGTLVWRAIKGFTGRSRT